MHYARSLCWFRRDLRLDDHAALAYALSCSQEVIGVFIFDTTILDTLPANDRRVAFIWDSLHALHTLFTQHHGALYVLHGEPAYEIPRLVQILQVQAVFTNRDYEPAAQARDFTINQRLSDLGIPFHTYKDHVIFEKDQVLTQQGTPYSVFMPYKKAWLNRLQSKDINPHPSTELLARLDTTLPNPPFPTLEDFGFGSATSNRIHLPAGSQGATTLLNDFLQRIDYYDIRRNFPSIKGLSYLSVHLRFGTLSIREAVRLAYHRSNLGSSGATTWLDELIWREFYSAILAHFPHVITQPFKPEYQNLYFSNREDYFQAWKEGKTGYPIVDAAMRQLNQSGYMHNRLRMIAASFLVKHLHIDWRWGEAYFALQLNDFDLASNNGGWQWCASTGCDAQPYFRIFNPITQSQKFDAEGLFIKRYIPELARCPVEYIHTPWKSAYRPNDYPEPIVDHATARAITLERYKKS